MSQFKQRFQQACLAVLRPVAGFARRMLTPATPPIEFVWQPIVDGPAAGTEALLPGGTAIADAITSGSYESDVISVVQHLVQEDDVCFDVGGHYGYFTFCLAKLAPRGQIHTFEPVESHADRIRCSAERSSLGHVTVHQVAMAGEVGEMTLRFADADGNDDSMAFLAPYGGVDTPAAHEHYQHFSRTTVRTVTLNSLVEELPGPRFIKIDAEGAEVAIVAASLQMIHAAKPRLLIELHGIYEALGCAEILQKAGYRAIQLNDQKTTLPVLWVSHDDEEALQKVKETLGREPTVLFDKATTEGKDSQT